MKNRVILHLVVICMAAVPLFAAGKLQTVSVISTAEVSADGFRLRLGGDGQGPYPAGTFQIFSTGTDWVQYVGGKNSTRTAWLDFAEPASDGSSAPFAAAAVPVQFVLKCKDRNIDLLNLTAGAVVYCPLLVHFDADGASYRVAMNSDSPNVEVDSADDAKVTCTAGSPCTGWQMTPSKVVGTTSTDNDLDPSAEPSVDPNPKNIGYLFRKDTVKGKRVDTLLGTYYFSFRIDLVK